MKRLKRGDISVSVVVCAYVHYSVEIIYHDPRKYTELHFMHKSTNMIDENLNVYI